MNITVQQLLEKSFVISIDNQRYEKFCKRFTDAMLCNPLPKLYIGVQIQNKVDKYAGFIKTKNICNCSLSHLGLVTLAKSMNFPFICIFEDDAIPHINSYEVLTNVLSSINEQIDMIKLGFIQKDHYNSNQLNNDIMKHTQTFGSHAYIIFKRYYDDYIELWKKNMIADCLVMNDKNHNILCLVNPLFIQDVYTIDNPMHNKDKQRLRIENSIDKEYLKNFRI